MKKILLPLSLLVLCLLALSGIQTPRSDAREDLLFGALYAMHTENHDPTEYTAYTYDGAVIEDFYELTAPMSTAELQSYCRSHIQKLTRLTVTEETSLRGEAMKTAYLTCTEAFRTPTDDQHLTIQYTVEGSAIYDESGTAYAYTYSPSIGPITYALPEGWSYSHLGHGLRESIRKTDGHAYFYYQFNSRGTYLGRFYDLGQSRDSFTIAP